jgi:hypothetical protein
MKVIVVRGGLVQGVYSKRREKIYVFDYDGDDPKEHERYEKEMADLIEKHNLKQIY